MINPCYILSKEDYDALVNVLTSMRDYVEDLPDSTAKNLIANGNKIALFVLGRDTDE